MKRVFVLLLLVTLIPARAAAAQAQYLHVSMRSALLSAFWGQSVSIDAHILLPDSYYKEPDRRYPVFYWIQGFGGTGEIDEAGESSWLRPMREFHTQYILVFLNGMFNGGHQEFADSANNGPWGAALTQEFIPMTEEHFRAIGTPQTRFVGGHSSGGWSALWLQITYPNLFGGEWSISPDPVDFRDFTGPDLTKEPPQNFYHDAAGNAYVLDGQSLRSFVTRRGWQERQFASFEAVFSPRGANGQPEPLFDRKTGVIDPAVEQYWESHYDISSLLRRQWSTLGPELQHKLHVIVGTSDNFGLEKPVALLQGELGHLGSDAEFDYAPGCNHYSVFDWNGGAIQYILKEADALLPPAT